MGGLYYITKGDWEQATTLIKQLVGALKHHFLVGAYACNRSNSETSDAILAAEKWLEENK